MNMTRAAEFTAELIRTTSRGLAGLSTARLFEKIDGAETRYGEGGFDSWRQALSARLEALASALEADDTKLFADDMVWFRAVITSREIDAKDVGLALESMRETLTAQLPGTTDGSIDRFFDAAVKALAEPATAAAGLTEGSRAHQLFELALLGDLASARNYLLEGVRSETFSLEEAVIDILLPAAREAGRRWHVGEMGVAAEHVITATLRSALHGLTAALPQVKRNGKAVLVTAVPGDAHDTGLVAFALLLEQNGWRVALAGADTPADEIDATAAAYGCDLIAVSATLVAQRYALTSYLATRTCVIPVLVGGAALRSEEDAKNLGADGFATDLINGVRSARDLVGLA